MAEFERKSLGEVLGERGYIRGPFGSSLVRSELEEKGIPVYEQQHAITGTREFRFFVNEQKFKELSRFQVRPNDLIISCSGTVGRISVVRPDDPMGIISQALLILRPHSRDVLPEFLYYFLSTPEGQHALVQASHGSVQVNIAPRAVVEQIKVPVPTLAEQRAIAHILGTLDDKIELNRQMNETSEAIARALFKSWFVDFDPVHAKAEGRDSGLPKSLADIFPDSFEDSELGAIPKGWTATKLGDTFSVVDFVANGSFASLKENVTLLDEPGYALFLRTTDYNKGFSGGFRFVSKDAYDFLSKSSLDGSEAIISNVGDVGTVFRPPSWLGWPMTLGSNAVAIKTHGLSNYVFRYFKERAGQDAIRSIVTGSAQPKFNKTNLRDLYIPMPLPPVAREFERHAAALAERNISALLDSKALTSLRDTLLPALISGKLRVKDAERFVAKAA